MPFLHKFAILSGKWVGQSARKPGGGEYEVKNLASDSFGKTVKTVDLRVNQEFTVTGENGGVNVVTVRDGKIAVTQANCPDHYCEKRGFCAGGTDIVCLPNRLVIHFLGAQTVDAQAG